MPSIVCLTDFDDPWNGLIYTLIENGNKIPSNDVLSFKTSKISDNNIPENVLDDNLKTFWGSWEIDPYSILNFGNNKVSLSGFSIYGITNPYTTAFNISGSIHGESWDLIEEYHNLGDELHEKSKTFQFDELTNLYNQIKIQSISSLTVNGEIHPAFGMRELEIYGVFISSLYFQKLICVCSNFNLYNFLKLLIPIYI